MGNNEEGLGEAAVCQTRIMQSLLCCAARPCRIELGSHRAENNRSTCTDQRNDHHPNQTFDTVDPFHKLYAVDNDLPVTTRLTQ